MSSGNDVQQSPDERLHLDAGAQGLVSVLALDHPIDLLPPSAYENLLVVTTTPPAELERRLRDRSVDVSTVGAIPISGSPVEYDGEMPTSRAVVPDDLTGLSMRFTQALDALAPGHGWVLFDTLDVFLLYADEDRVYRFLDHVTARTRECDLRGVYAVVRDAVDERTFANLRRRFDREIDRH